MLKNPKKYKPTHKYRYVHIFIHANRTTLMYMPFGIDRPFNVTHWLTTEVISWRKGKFGPCIRLGLLWKGYSRGSVHHRYSIYCKSLPKAMSSLPSSIFIISDICCMPAIWAQTAVWNPTVIRTPERPILEYDFYEIRWTIKQRNYLLITVPVVSLRLHWIDVQTIPDP